MMKPKPPIITHVKMPRITQLRHLEGKNMIVNCGQERLKMRDETIISSKRVVQIRVITTPNVCLELMHDNY